MNAAEISKRHADSRGVKVFGRSAGTWHQDLSRDASPHEKFSVEFLLSDSPAKKKLHVNSKSLSWSSSASSSQGMTNGEPCLDRNADLPCLLGCSFGQGVRPKTGSCASQELPPTSQSWPAESVDSLLRSCSKQLQTVNQTLSMAADEVFELRSNQAQLRVENERLTAELHISRMRQHKLSSPAATFQDDNNLQQSSHPGTPADSFNEGLNSPLFASAQEQFCGNRQTIEMQGVWTKSTGRSADASWRLHITDRIAEFSQLFATRYKSEPMMIFKKSTDSAYDTRASDYDPSTAATEHFRIWSLLQRFIMHPNSKWCLVLDLVGGLLVMYDIAVAPMPYFGFWDDSSSFITTVMLFATIYWTVDIARTFMTGREDSGNLEMRAIEIAKHYAKTWLFVDIFVVLWDWLQIIFSPSISGKASRSWHFAKMGRPKAMHALRALRILRLIRVVKLPILMKTLEDRIQSAVVMVFFKGTQIITLILLASHWAACYWYACGSWDSLGFADSWVKRYVFDQEDPAHLYFLSLHWSLGQSGLASTQISPTNVIECLYAGCVSLLWLVMLSGLFSFMTVTLIKACESGSELSEQEAKIRKYFSEKRVSAALGVSVLRFFRLHYKARARRVHPDDVVFLGDLPVSLCAKLHREIGCPVLMKHPVFEKLGMASPLSLLAICDLAWLQRHCCAGQEVFAMGTIATQTLFVASGRLKYFPCSTDLDVSPTNSAAVTAGCWVSEPALWFRWRHRGSLRAVTSCELLGLDVATFCAVAAELRHAGQLSIAFLMKYAETLKESAEEGLTGSRSNLAGTAGSINSSVDAESEQAFSSEGQTLTKNVVPTEILEDFGELHRITQRAFEEAYRWLAD